MKLHFYGTAASEGVPAIFCECAYCKKIRALGGKNYRFRTCAQVDEGLLIDFSMDGYAQTLCRGLPLSAIDHLLVTHSHEDHLFPLGLMQIKPPMAYYDRERHLDVYGNGMVMKKIREMVDAFNPEGEILRDYLGLREVSPFETFSVGDYRVTALPANHDKREDCFIYVIEREGHTLLYGHDSAMFAEETWEALGRFSFDCVVLDCTMVEKTGIFAGHMGLPDNIRVRERMLAEGMADAHTRFVATHFVHSQNPVHERITPIFAEKGFIAAYDGMEVEF